MKGEGKMQRSADDYRSRVRIRVGGRLSLSPSGGSRSGSGSVSSTSATVRLSATAIHLLFRKYFPFLLAGRMNPTFPNNPSPGSSVFDFPAHRETAHKHHPGTSSLLPSHPPDSGSFIVVSGGSGCNPICSAFGPDACYVLPISDDGGSSSEIIRVLGGPSIGVSGCPNDALASVYLSAKVT